MFNERNLLKIFFHKSELSVLEGELSSQGDGETPTFTSSNRKRRKRRKRLGFGGKSVSHCQSPAMATFIMPTRIDQPCISNDH